MSQSTDDRADPQQWNEEPRPGTQRPTRARTLLLAIIAVVLAGMALRETAWLSMPLAFSIFIALAIWPLDSWVRQRVPRYLKWLGTAAAAALLLVVLAAFFGALWYAAAQVVSGFPGYADELAEAWNNLVRQLPYNVQPDEAPAGNGEQVVSGILDVIAKTGQSANLLDHAARYATTLINSVGGTLAFLALIFFLVLLMLTDAGNWRATLAGIAARHSRIDWPAIADAVARQFRWYLVVRTFLGAVTGVLYGLWLWIWGVDFVFVWGMLAFLLNYVPTVGSLVAGILPIAFAFLQLDLWTAVIVGIGLLAIEQLMGNYVDSRLLGRELALSPPVVLVSLLFWSWLWGVGGALIAVPMTALVALVCSHVPRLRPVALMLASTSRTERA